MLKAWSNIAGSLKKVHPAILYERCTDDVSIMESRKQHQWALRPHILYIYICMTDKWM